MAKAIQAAGSGIFMALWLDTTNQNGGDPMLFETYGDRKNPAVLFFHAMGVTGASSSPVAEHL